MTLTPFVLLAAGPQLAGAEPAGPPSGFHAILALSATRLSLKPDGGDPRMATWTKSEVRRLIVQALAPAVANAGFRFRTGAGAFVRSIPGGRQELGLSLVDYSPLYEFSFALCVRLEAVQALVNRFSGSPPRYHNNTLTTITQLEFLGLPAEPGRGVVYRVDSESKLLELLPRIVKMIQDRVLPFFEEYRDIQAVNRGLNPKNTVPRRDVTFPPDRRAFDATNQPYRSMTALVVAHLARDPRVPDLVEVYRAQLREASQPDREKFEQLVAHLIS